MILTGVAQIGVVSWIGVRSTVASTVVAVTVTVVALTVSAKAAHDGLILAVLQMTEAFQV